MPTCVAPGHVAGHVSLETGFGLQGVGDEMPTMETRQLERHRAEVPIHPYAALSERDRRTVVRDTQQVPIAVLAMGLAVALLILWGGDPAAAAAVVLATLGAYAEACSHGCFSAAMAIAGIRIVDHPRAMGASHLMHRRCRAPASRRAQVRWPGSSRCLPAPGPEFGG